MSVGPIAMLVAVAGNQFKGKIIPALQELGMRAPSASSTSSSPSARAMAPCACSSSGGPQRALRPLRSGRDRDCRSGHGRRRGHGPRMTASLRGAADSPWSLDHDAVKLGMCRLGHIRVADESLPAAIRYGSPLIYLV